jgi:HTH-like domain
MKEMRFDYSIPRMCRVFKVAASGYYAWLKRPRSKRAQEEERLQVEIKAAHKRTRGTYGSERLKTDLAEHGVKVGVHRIKRIRKVLGIRCKQKKKFKATTDSTHTLPVADNLLGQKFTVTEPRQAWVSDITYIATDEGWLYCAAHKDLFNGEIVGYALGAPYDTGPRQPIALSGSGCTSSTSRPYPSFGPGQPVLQFRIPEAAQTVRHESLDEQERQLLRQCPHGEFLGHAQE